MKLITLFPAIVFSLVLGACAAVPAEMDAPPTTSPTLSPSATSTSTVTPTASPTPIFTLEPGRYDPDIHRAVGMDHLQPLIYQADEIALLAFFTYSSMDYCLEPQGCRITSRLYYTYGESGSFQSMSLVQETISGLEQQVARLPAADPAGGSLRYYLETSFPEAAYTQRYPVAGTIDLFTTKKLISIELPAANPVEPGDKMYLFYWGMGPNTVRHGGIRGSPVESGPSAMDVASDGRIALLNPVNNGVLIYDPKEESFSNFMLPFPNSHEGDLAFDQNDQLMVCDFSGAFTPYCYRLLLDGTVEGSVPTYAASPRRLTKDLRVMDDYDYKLVLPFDAQGKANSREAQRQKQTWELPFGLVLDGKGELDWRRARFADVEAGLAFEVHSELGVSTLVGFERTPQGYLILLNSEYQQIRAIWIDPAGAVLKDVSLPKEEYSGFSSGAGNVAVDQDGSLYVMSSTKNGIEIHFEAAP
ncbi:MAG: hypothetical protein WCC12_19680 [Anaerolineales bacterium]